MGQGKTEIRSKLHQASNQLELMKSSFHMTIEKTIEKHVGLMMNQLTQLIQKVREARNANDEQVVTEDEPLMPTQSCSRMLLPQVTKAVITIEEDKRRDKADKGEATKISDLRSVSLTLPAKHHDMALLHMSSKSNRSSPDLMKMISTQLEDNNIGEEQRFRSPTSSSWELHGQPVLKKEKEPPDLHGKTNTSSTMNNDVALEDLSLQSALRKLENKSFPPLKTMSDGASIEKHSLVEKLRCRFAPKDQHRPPSSAMPGKPPNLVEGDRGDQCRREIMFCLEVGLTSFFLNLRPKSKQNRGPVSKTKSPYLNLGHNWVMWHPKNNGSSTISPCHALNIGNIKSSFSWYLKVVQLGCCNLGSATENEVWVVGAQLSRSAFGYDEEEKTPTVRWLFDRGRKACSQEFLPWPSLHNKFWVTRT
ncbi:uncharacterized protein LOC133038010 [Cannabis sativa]|uniref:uncharacterized protein LOC133038010 n=1 Tax=Cannabis sativa TaxID=3483 RepID=UPI0029C9BF97|nr:uncharacterized protein LOC133038010 [Cannabis sativa]